MKAASDTKNVDTRPDRVSAMSTAQAQKSRVEDLSARTPDSSTFAEPDGSWTVESYAGPVRTQNDDGKWVDLDSDLSKHDGAYAPAASAVDQSFSDGGDTTIASVRTDQGDDLKVGWPDKLPTPKVDGSTLTYPGCCRQRRPEGPVSP